MSFKQSVRFALQGLRYVYRHERNFRVHVAFSVVAVVLSLLLDISVTQWIFVITAIASVFVLEIVNTVFETVLDILHPRVHHYAGAIKDLMAAAVLVASVSALMVGCFIFIPIIISRLS